MTAYPTAAPSSPGVVAYRHVQAVPATVWTVNHNLGFRPGGVHVELSDGTDAIGDVIHIDTNTLTISLGTNSLSGEAYIS